MSESEQVSLVNNSTEIFPEKLTSMGDKIENGASNDIKDIQVTTTKIDELGGKKIEQFKPLNGTKAHVYTMHELLEIGNSVPDLSHVLPNLHIPKKSFWRLTNRHPDIRQSEMGASTGNGHKNGSNFRVQEFGAEKKNHRTKNTRNAKRGSKFAKGDKPYLEEKDVQVNNDDLLALEEKIKPTGNSITDFENWRKKMKELEGQKKGHSANGSSDAIERPTLSNNGSSISDFFNLNRQSSSNFEELEPEQESLESAKTSSHSRFSSFFNTGPAASKNESSSMLAQPPTPKETEAKSGAGSRILSFFDNMEATKGAAEKQPQPNAASIPSAPTPPVQEQTNSHFFQGLLNRGKVSPSPKPDDRRASNDNIASKARAPLPYSPSGGEQPKAQDHQRARAPPGLSTMPGNGPIVSPQGPSGYPMGMSMNMYSQTPPMAQPPAGFQQFQMPPPGVGMPQPFFNNQGQTGEKDNKAIRPPNMQLPFIPGPHNIPPPGFAPMHGMPRPNMPQDMPLSVNNMMPPPPGFFGQGASIPPYGNPQMAPHALNNEAQQRGMRLRETK
ncbi:LAFA_0E03202g1_1 [Lachancea sp. 'fantastica']|nr:LAFA_0E03202g1_1 [Lachancea sp. 'fantastica']